MANQNESKLNADGNYSFAEHERKLAQRFNDENAAEAYVGMLRLQNCDGWKRLLADAYLAGLRAEREAHE